MRVRSWFWILIAAISIVAIAALVIAIAANNESVDQKKIAEEASDHVVAKVAGLGQAVKAGNELQAEGEERSEADRRQIQKDVKEAVAAGEGELDKVRSRVRKLEDELGDRGKVDQRLEKQIAALAAADERLTAEVKDLKAQVRELTKTANRASQK